MWFGSAVLLLTGATIVVPYWRGKAELVSAWNFLLLGVAIFAGIGCYEAAINPLRFPGVEWFNPTKAEVNWFMMAWTVFLVALYASYYWDPISRWSARRFLVKWPPLSMPVFFYVMIVCMALSLTIFSPTLLSMPFFGRLFINVSHKAFIFGCLFSFVLWYRNPRNLLWFSIFVVVFLVMCLLSMYAAVGRRLLLSVFLVPLCVIYYYHARHWRPTWSMAAIALGLLAVFIVNLMYNSIRHFHHARGQEVERSVANIIEQVKGVGGQGWLEYFANEKLFNLSQQVAHYSMLTDRMVRISDIEPRLLNTFVFIIAYPIPRAIWPEKPQSLGNTIVKDSGIVRVTTTNWGCGVPGHAAYEGGLLAAILYAYMAGFGVRFLDDLLRSQPTNPFLLGILAAGAMHILAWPRGDLLNMTVETAEAFFFAAALGIGGRLLFGTQRLGPVMQWRGAPFPLPTRAPAP
jgi:hypothetical protein